MPVRPSRADGLPDGRYGGWHAERHCEPLPDSDRDRRPCRCCGDPGGYVPREGYLCDECSAEIIHGFIPPMEEVTSTRYHVPAGTVLRRPQRVPGAGDGNDWFGSHT